VSKKLVVFLTDPLSAFHAKGEIRDRYYNPGDIFSEVHFISPAAQEVAPAQVQPLAGTAQLIVHPLGPRYYATAWRRRGPVGALLRNIRPDAIRAYDPGVRGSLAVWWGRRLGVPSVVSVHADLDEQRAHERRPLHAVRTLFENYALQRATAVICVSRHVQAYAVRHGARHPVVIRNRVHLSQFAAAGAREPRDMVTIVSVGRQTFPKFQECLIRAVQPLPARLVLVGDGDQQDALKRLVDALSMRDRVMFVRAVPHSRIADCYHDADIFAIATHYEGFCIPVLEAMAAGLPVVASRIPAIEELLGADGMLVPNDPPAFTTALRSLIDNPGLQRDMGARLAARARTMDGATMEEQERALYEALAPVPPLVQHPQTAAAR
jgi:glycosyltransferase involved in cell wall biosynthesis